MGTSFSGEQYAAQNGAPENVDVVAGVGLNQIRAGDRARPIGVIGTDVAIEAVPGDPA